MTFELFIEMVKQLSCNLLYTLVINHKKCPFAVQ